MRLTCCSPLLVALVIACDPGGPQSSEIGESETENGTSESETGTDAECPLVEPLPEPSACVEQRSYVELGDRWACGGALGGWVLLCDDNNGMLTLAHLGVDDQLAEITQIAGTGSGFITRERDEDRLWILEQPDTLHELDLSGMLLSSVVLGVSNIGSTDTLTRFEGDLIRTYRLTDQSAITLERRGPTGKLRWSLAVGELMFDGRIADAVHSLGIRDGVLTMLASHYGIDSASVGLVALDPSTGAPLWDLLLTPDDFSGPRLGLGGLDESVIVELMDEADPPHRIQVFAVDGEGDMIWERSDDVPELPPILSQPGIVPLGGDLAVLVRGHTPDIEERFGLVRFPANGGPPCWAAFEPFGSLFPASVTQAAIGGGRIIVGQSGAPGPLSVIGDGVGGCVDDP
jgi:outer membrane protein assembly factor BamB